MKTFFRWIGILPAACLGFFVAFALAHVFLSISSYLSGDGFDLFPDKEEISWRIGFMVPLLSAMAAAYFFIYAGWIMAPEHKKRVGYILVLFMVLYLFVGFFAIGVSAYKHTWPTHKVLGETIGVMAAIIAACVKLKNNSDLSPD